MKSKKNCQIYFMLFCLLMSSINCSFNDSLDPADQYLRQKQPGSVPEIFAPGIISNEDKIHGFPAISPNGKEIYWSIIPPKIKYVQFRDGNWTTPQIAPFSQRNIQAPCFYPGGKKLFFQMSRKDGEGSLDIWYVKKLENGWSDPINIGPPVNSPKLESQPSFTRDGTLYFTGTLEGAMFNRGIYRAKMVDGKYQSPKLLKEPINTKFLEIYPFIAPDESFLLFCSTRPTMDEKNRNIFISFRDQDDNWSNPINLSEKLNLKPGAAFPYLSPDGEFLFFTGGGIGPGINWVKSDVIKNLKVE